MQGSLSDINAINRTNAFKKLDEDNDNLAIIARIPSEWNPELVLSGGGSAVLDPVSVVQEPMLLLALDAEQRTGPRGPEVRVRVASAVEPEWLLDLFPERLTDAFADDIARAEPVYARFPGWGKLPAAPHGVADLPAAARTYIETIERMAGVPFCLVSVGPDRTETIRLHDPFAPVA